MSADSGAEHKTRVRVNFDRQAPDYDRVGPRAFAWFGTRLVETVGVQPGARVLDVASGRGAVLFPATEKAGPSGAVTGIDLSPEMARITNEDARQRGFDTQVRVMDAENLDFADASFDYVLCGFGIMFFPDQNRALSEFRRVLKPGGWLAVSTWHEPQNHDLLVVLRDLQISWQLESGWIPDPDKLERLIAQAGFTDVQILADSHEFRYADIDEYWQSVRGTRIRHLLDTLDAEQTTRVRAAFANRVRDRQRTDGLYLAATALLAVAIR
jgi:ubiquinone/menaquinone biosynthesis C-methylase UbiE